MRNSNTKVRCEKRKLTKCNGIVKTYSEVQYAFADVLENDSTIKEFISNFPLTDFPLTDGKYKIVKGVLFEINSDGTPFFVALCEVSS